MTHPAFDLFSPQGAPTGYVFASPHSGCDYFPEFLARSQLDPRAIRSSEDAFVDRLFSGVTSLGAALIVARAPRAYVDLNRSADELDPAVVDGAPRPAANPRISAGLGVIPRVVSNGRAIYRGKIPLAEAQARIDGYWRPYHQKLAALVQEARLRQGRAALIDCHSMPHEAIEAFATSGRPRPEIVLGDRYGAACAPPLMERLEEAFRAEGLSVARNAPFAGAYVVQTYGRPLQGVDAVQIEIDRALYMDELAICPNARFDDVRQMLTRVMARVIGPRSANASLAAE